MVSYDLLSNTYSGNNVLCCLCTENIALRILHQDTSLPCKQIHTSSHTESEVTMSHIIEIRNVTKEFKVLNRREGLKGSLRVLFSRDYKIVRAVDNVSMDIDQGEIVGYLGPNGAGKSTTIKMMTGVLEPSSGEILVNGAAPYKNRTRNAQEIGVVFGQRSQLWWALPLVESFKILKDIYQIDDKQYSDMMDLYRSLVDIEPLLHKPVRQMSLGQRTLSDILAAFLHDPKIVFLDEPTIGLDGLAIMDGNRIAYHFRNDR